MRRLFILACIVLLYSCSPPKKEIYSDDLVISLNMNEITNINIEPLCSIFSFNDVISLELTKESIIQRIDKIKFINNRIFILDTEGANSILVFSCDGKSIGSIGKRGKGPGEYLSALDFDIVDSTIHILSHKKVLQYKLNGELVKDTPLDFYASYFSVLSDKKHYAFYGSSKEDRVILSDLEGKRVLSAKAYSPFQRITPLRYNPRMDSLTVFHIPNSDTVFRVLPTGIETYFVLDFKRASFSWEEYYDFEKNGGGNIQDLLYNSDNYAYKFTFLPLRFYEYISVVFQQKAYGVLYSKKSRKIRSYLLTDSNSEQCMWFRNIHALPVGSIDNDKIVFAIDYPKGKIIESRILEERLRQGEQKISEHTMQAKINTLYSQINENSNPILLIVDINEERSAQ